MGQNGQKKGQKWPKMTKKLNFALKENRGGPLFARESSFQKPKNLMNLKIQKKSDFGPNLSKFDKNRIF